MSMDDSVLLRRALGTLYDLPMPVGGSSAAGDDGASYHTRRPDARSFGSLADPYRKSDTIGVNPPGDGLFGNDAQYGGLAGSSSRFGNASNSSPLLGNGASADSLFGNASKNSTLLGNASSSDALLGNASANTLLYGNASGTGSLFDNSYRGSLLGGNAAKENVDYDAIFGDWPDSSSGRNVQTGGTAGTAHRNAGGSDAAALAFDGPLGGYDSAPSLAKHHQITHSGPVGDYHNAVNERNKAAKLLQVASAASDIGTHRDELLHADGVAQAAWHDLSATDKRKAAAEDAALGLALTPSAGIASTSIAAIADQLASSATARIAPQPPKPGPGSGTGGVSYWSGLPGAVIGPFHQGSGGSCTLLAGISALSSTDGGKAMVNLVKAKGDGTYAVTFPGAPGKTYTVTPRELNDAKKYATGDSAVDVIQLAADKWRKETQGESIFDGLPLDQGFELLSGAPAKTISRTLGDGASTQAVRNAIVDSAAMGEPALATFYLHDRNKPEKPDEVAPHAIAINNYDPKSGAVTFTNPWNSADQMRMNIDDLLKGVTNVDSPGLTADVAQIATLA